jgi:hypothetical protein
MRKKTIASTLAGLVLVGASLAVAAPAGATPGLCDHVTATESGSTVYVTNPCGNLSGRYRLEAWALGGTTIYESTVTLSPGQTTTFQMGSGGWGVFIL